MEKNFNNREKPFILIVDDVSRNLQVIGNILLEEGFEISLASDGYEALETVRMDKPDLILLDIMMPDINGYEVCTVLKADESTKDIPVIFLTAKTETEDIVQGFQIGGEDYITKPFKKEELLVRINTHLRLKKARDIILQQNEELKKLNDEKNEFLGIATHDLKNPLNSIKGLAELILMEDGETPKDEILEYAGLIKSSSDYMLQIILDLLNVNAIEEGRINYELTYFDIGELVHTLVDKFRMQAEAKQITLHYNSSFPMQFCEADMTRMQQVIENLISNAIKFSQFNKNIWIDLKKGRTFGTIIVQIKDEGPGLSSEDLTKLFGKFVRLSPRPTNGENSTGLGLSIVKKLVEAMNGEIWCESELGKGATFILELKVK